MKPPLPQANPSRKTETASKRVHTPLDAVFFVPCFPSGSFPAALWRLPLPRFPAGCILAAALQKGLPAQDILRSIFPIQPLGKFVRKLCMSSAGRSGARLRAAGWWPLRFGSSPASWPFGRRGRTSPCRPLCPGRIPQRRIPKSPQCVPCDAAAPPCAGSVPRPRSRCTHRPGSNSGCPVSADSKFPKTVGRAVLSAPVHRSVDRLPCNPPMCFSGT